MPCPTSVELEEVCFLCLYFLLNHNFNFVLVVHVRHSQTSLTLLSLNHNFLTIHDVYALGGVEHAATLQIVNLG